MSNLIYLTNARLSFPALVEAQTSKKFPNSPPMFSADFIIPMNDPALTQFMQEYANLAVAEWKENANAVMQMIQQDRRARCFGQGSEKRSETTLQVHPGYEGNAWIGAKNKSRPQMIRADGKPAANDMEAMEIARKMYGGCYVNAVVHPWIRTTNRGVSCDLVAIQFVKDGEPFGDATGAVDASGMFGAVATAPAAAPAPAAMPFPPFMGMPQ